jgi:hypothetical protein
VQVTFPITDCTWHKEDYAPTDEQIVGWLAVHTMQRKTNSISEVLELCAGSDMIETSTNGSNRRKCENCKSVKVLKW